MINKIYLDMDGVIANFEKRYIEIFNETPNSARDRKMFKPNWKEFVEGKNFETLEWWPGGQELLAFIRKNSSVSVEILSSSGGEKYHGVVEEQKKAWLKKQGILYKANIVPGRKLKSQYATPNTILIDDTNDVIDAFNKAGGVGILHKDVKETIKVLDMLLNK